MWQNVDYWQVLGHCCVTLTTLQWVLQFFKFERWGGKKQAMDVYM